ncbi:lysosomal aspartic protease-like [Fopius arisanus]|uniref:AAEL006169_2 protein n=1 Tax=Fopius arisanus TaxID=64838 RepID=A0A0C9QDQ8_9HYME|nr:PREDICTED: lysosomal aspartic protease-like [Fopius arisanus]
MIFLTRYFWAILVIWGSFSTNSGFVIDIYRDDSSRSGNELIDYSSARKDTWDYEVVTLYKFLNAEYYGIIRIGRPAQEFKVVFDTAWGDSWVPSQHCGFTELSCMLHKRYDSSKSSTYRENGTLFSRKDSELELSGFLSVDNFHLEHLEVVNQTFIEMTHMSWKPFSFWKADGIIGLGWKTLAIDGTVPFFYNMIKQKIAKQNIFTFYMNRDETTNKAGKLILGNTERSHAKGNLTYVRVVKKGYWTIVMDRLTIEGKKTNKTYAFCKNNCQVVMDTSANTISGPANEIQAINNLLGAKQVWPYWPYKYMVHCREYALLPHVTFVFNDREFTIESKYYIQHVVYDGVEACLSPFVPSPLDIWELGGAFLMQFYTEFDFDNERIGIAETVF